MRRQMQQWQSTLLTFLVALTLILGQIPLQAFAQAAQQPENPAKTEQTENAGEGNSGKENTEPPETPTVQGQEDKTPAADENANVPAAPENATSENEGKNVAENTNKDGDVSNSGKKAAKGAQLAAASDQTRSGGDQSSTTSIDSVSLTVTPPSAGTASTIATSQVSSTTAGINEISAVWQDHTGVGTQEPDTLDFVEGDTYYALIYIYPEDNYEFAKGYSHDYDAYTNNYDFNGTVNVTGGTVEKTGIYDGSGRLFVLVSVTATAASQTQEDSHFSVWISDKAGNANTGGSYTVAYGDFSETYSASTSKDVASNVEVTLTANPTEGYEFAGWYQANINGPDTGELRYFEDRLISSSATYTFTGNPIPATMDQTSPYVCAVFKAADKVRCGIASDHGGVGMNFTNGVSGQADYISTASTEATSGIRASAFVKSGTEVTLSSDPAEGYVLQGWYAYDGSELGELLSTARTYTYTATAPTNVKAIFESQQSWMEIGMACSEGGSYDYAIDRWEGDAGASDTGVVSERIFSATQSGSQYRLVAHPDTGYAFDGWYKTNKYGGHYTNPTDELLSKDPSYAFTMNSLTNKTGVYAKFVSSSHEVSFDMGGHYTDIQSQQVPDGEKATRPANPTNYEHASDYDTTHLHFDKWTTVDPANLTYNNYWYSYGDGDGAIYSFNTAVTEDLQLYANYWGVLTISPYDVTNNTSGGGTFRYDSCYFRDGGNSGQSTQLAGTTVKLTNYPNEGYQFLGWSTSTSTADIIAGSNVDEFEYVFDGAITLYPLFGKPALSVTVNGLYDTVDDMSAIVSSVTVNGQTLDMDTYSVGGGEIQVGGKYIDANTPVTIVLNPTANGMFMAASGYHADDEGTCTTDQATGIGTVTFNMTEDMNVSLFVCSAITITCDPNGGTPTDKYEGDAVRLPADYAELLSTLSVDYIAAEVDPPTGADFKALEVKDKNGTHIGLPGETLTNLDFSQGGSFKWLWSGMATVTFDSNGGTGEMADDYAVQGEVYVLPECDFTAPAGKAFDTWKIGNDTYDPTYSYTVPDDAETVSVVAQWKDVVTVSGSIEGGPADNPASALSVFTIDDVATFGPATFDVPTGEIWIVATAADGWAIEDMKLYKNGNLIGTTQTLGRTAITGISGISSSADFSVVVTVYPTVIVTFDTNGGIPRPAGQKIRKGTKATKPETDPQKDGWFFDHWYDSQDTDKAEFDFDTELVESDITLEAAWAHNMSICAYNKTNSGATEGGVVQINSGTTASIGNWPFFEGDDITIKAIPDTGYMFLGWSTNETNPADNIVSTDIEYTIEGFDGSPDYLVAVFAETATITFDKNGGFGNMSPVTVEKGSTYTLPECDFLAPHILSQDFAAWQIAGHLGMRDVGYQFTVNENVTVTALWKDVIHVMITQGEDAQLSSVKFNGTEVTLPYSVTLDATETGVPLSIVATPTSGNAASMTGMKNDLPPIILGDYDNATGIASKFIESADAGTYVFRVSTDPAVTVHFDAQGGTPAPADQILPTGGHATEPAGDAKPQKDHFSLAHWYTGDDPTDNFLFILTPVNEDVTLKAAWMGGVAVEGHDVTDPTNTEQAGTITIDLDGTGAVEQPYPLGATWAYEMDEVTLTATAADGYRFVGWAKQTDQGFTTIYEEPEYTFIFGPSTEMLYGFRTILDMPQLGEFLNVHALFEEINLTFDNAGGTVGENWWDPNPQRVTAGTNLSEILGDTVPEAPPADVVEAPEGKVFDGYRVTMGDTNRPTTFIVGDTIDFEITESATVEYLWRDPIVTLHWSSLDGLDQMTPIKTAPVPAGSTIADALATIDKQITDKDFFEKDGYEDWGYRTHEAMSEYNSYEAMLADEFTATDRVSGDVDIYVDMIKQIDKVMLTLEEPPTCGTEVTAEESGGRWQWDTQNPAPKVTLADGAPYVFDTVYGTDVPWCFWLADNDTWAPFVGTFKGGNDYPLEVWLRASFGYTFSDDVSTDFDGVNGAAVDYDGGYIGITAKATAVHVPGEAKHENEKAATCTEKGSYDEVVRCTECDEIISSTPKQTDALGHDWGEWKVVKEPTTSAAGTEQRTCSRCGEKEERAIPILDGVYKFVEGDGSVWEKNLQKGLTFRIKRTTADEISFDHFKGLKIDGADVPVYAYEARSGSVVVTLKPFYLFGLDEGEHTIQALFDDSTDGASATFTVKAASSSAGSGKYGYAGRHGSVRTGDVVGVGIAVTVGVALAALGAMMIARRRRRDDDK